METALQNLGEIGSEGMMMSDFLSRGGYLQGFERYERRLHGSSLQRCLQPL